MRYVAAQSMLGGIGSLTLVANTIFAPLIAEEVLTWTHVWATMFIIVGCSMVVAYGPHSTEVHSARQLFDMLASPGFILYILMMAGMGFYLHNALTKISKAVESSVPAASAGPAFEEEAIRRAAAAARQSRSGAVATSHRGGQHPESGSRRGQARAQSRLRMPAVPRVAGRGQPPFVVTESGMILDYSKSKQPWASYHLHRSGFAVMSAIFGALNVLFAKLLSQVMASAVLSTTAFYEEASLSSAMAVVVLFCIILIAVATVGQMKYINDATQRFEALLVQPIYQATWTLLSVTGGMIVQREWVLFTDFHKGLLFFVGIFCTMSGAFLLSTVRASGIDSSAHAAEGAAAASSALKAGTRRRTRRQRGGNRQQQEEEEPAPVLGDDEDAGEWDEEAAAGRRLLEHAAAAEDDERLVEEPLEGVFGAGGLCDGSSRVGGSGVAQSGLDEAAAAEADDLTERQSVLSKSGASSHFGQSHQDARRASEADSFDDGAGGVGGSNGRTRRMRSSIDEVDGLLSAAADDGGTGGLRAHV
jgi:hypothetical protein